MRRKYNLKTLSPLLLLLNEILAKENGLICLNTQNISYSLSMPRKLISEHRFFLSIFTIYVIAGALSFIFYKQGNEILFFNELRTPFLNEFFEETTELVEVTWLVSIGLVLLFLELRYVVIYLADIILVTTVVRILKVVFFPERIRPALFFGPTIKLNFVQGVDILRYYSFPSGHTTMAFALCFLLAIFIRRTWASLILLVMALLVGLSRIYLLEHFWVDVYFGSLLGMLLTLLVYIGVQKPLMRSENKVLQFSIYDRYFKRIVK